MFFLTWSSHIPYNLHPLSGLRSSCWSSILFAELSGWSGFSVLGQNNKSRFRHGTSFYGTGEVSGAVERTGKRVFSWNTDAWGYNQNSLSLYQSHPWVFSILPNGQAFGVLADTTKRCEAVAAAATALAFEWLAHSMPKMMDYRPLSKLYMWDLKLYCAEIM